MQIKVVRQVFTGNSTIGQMFVDGKFECFTLEDMVRPVKIAKETAIPAGSYKMTLRMSPHFKVRTPALDKVPNYENVLIHFGNDKSNTDGCILVGQSKSVDFIGSSMAAFKALMPKLEAAVARGEPLGIEIVEEREALTRGRGAPVTSAGAKKAVPRKVAAKKVAVKKAPAKKVVPAKKMAPAKKATPVKKAAAAKKTAPAKKLAPAKKAVPAAKKAAPTAKKVAAKKAAAKNAAPAPARRRK